MSRTLNRELALISAGAALASLRSPRLRTAFSVFSAGLFLASLRKNFCFKDKSVVITGGSRGLGLSLAWNVLERGASAVTLIARDQQELVDARRQLLQDFPAAEVWITTCDVTKPKDLACAIEQAIKNASGIDVLVNNAGSILVGPYESFERAEFEALMDLHFYAVLEATKIITPHFRSRGGGRILNICSMGGKWAIPHLLAYDVSKFALAGFAQGARTELARHGIVITTAYPTVMRTGSPIQAVFKGDQATEFAWFNTIDNLPFVSMSAHRAANKILDAVADGRGEIILSPQAKVGVVFQSLFPETMSAIFSLAVRLLPENVSLERKMGIDVARSGRARKVEAMYNQRPHHDAERSMGLQK